MRRKIPDGSVGQTMSINTHGANIVRTLWFLHSIPNKGVVGATGFELLTADGDDIKLVDEFDNGWLRNPSDLHNLICELDQLMDQLTDYICELRAKHQKLTSEQLELPF